MIIRQLLIVVSLSCLGVVSYAAPFTSLSFTSTDIYANGSPSYSYDQTLNSVANSENTYQQNSRTVTATGTASLSQARLGASSFYGSQAVAPSSTFWAAYGRAGMRDTFYHSNITDNNPFVWSAGDVAQFTLDVSGGASTLDQLGRYDGSTQDLTAGGFVFFSAYDLNGAQIFAYTIGLTKFDTKYYEPGLGYVPVHTMSTGLPQTFNVNFNPGGDFGWQINLHTYAISNNGVNRAEANSDYSHTVNVSYAAPAGSIFRSESGIFATAVTELPEPSSIALLGLGLAGLGVARFRKQA